MKFITPNRKNLLQIWKNGSENWLISFFPALFIAIVIVILSAIPGNRIHLPPIWNIDKYIHLGVYFVQTLTLMTGFRLYYGSRLPLRRAILISLTLAVSMGGLLEILQEYVFISRSGDYLDFTANTLGAVSASIIASVILTHDKSPG